MKRMSIKAEFWKPEPCICIRNITQHYDEEFLTSYFENKHFGGSKVASVELLGNGEAVVMFMDHRGRISACLYKISYIITWYYQLLLILLPWEGVVIFSTFCKEIKALTSLYNQGLINV